MPAQRQHNTLIERILHQAETNPAHDAIVTPTFTLSYAHLAQFVRAQINKYDNIGITGNSVIGIKCADETRHLVLCLAATHFGATTCTIPTYEGETTQNAVISSCGATHVVDENSAVGPMSLDGNVGAATIETPAPDAGLLFSTSGTTGEPKLVLHHDSDLVAQAHRHVESEQERFACVASVEQNFAKRHRLYCVAAGATNVFLDADQQSLVAQCQSLNVNVLHVSAFQARELMATPGIAKLADIRLKLGGSHVPLSLREQLRNSITRNLQAGYGTTETGAIGFTDPDDQNAGESVGQPLPGIEIRAVTADRQPLGIDERGELAIRCDGMFRGYLGNSDLTSARLEDGWFYTGDIGYLDKQQRIHLCGRSDDMFLFNSMNIYPQDIESQICKYPDVIDAAVLPRKSAAHGNIPVALIVFAKDVKPKLVELKKFVRKQVGVRSPRQFTVVKEIPRNASGKISRIEAMALSTENNQVRRTIVEALADTCATDSAKLSLLTAFENGERVVRLKKLGIDSLARMEIMVALEVNHDVIIMPHEFPRLRTLDDIAARVSQPPLQDELSQISGASSSQSGPTLNQVDTQPYVVRFFRRIFSYCHTAAHLNKALTTLESRLAPTEVECLYECHLRGQLFPSNTAVKFQSILVLWYQGMQRMMSGSGKSQPEPFVSHRITCTVTHCVGPGSPADKTLLVCFSTQGGRRLVMPNAVLMQHTDSGHHDLLIISEPLGENYQRGVPGLGRNMIEVIEWLDRLKLMGDYSRIRTVGCSAGGYAAVIAGHLLGAEMAVSIGGRIPSNYKPPINILHMILTTWRAMRKKHCPRVLVSYAVDNPRDQKFASVMARLFGSKPDVVEFENEKVGHNILARLLERGELAPYLARTIFAEINDELVSTEQEVCPDFRDHRDINTLPRGCDR